MRIRCPLCNKVSAVPENLEYFEEDIGDDTHRRFSDTFNCSECGAYLELHTDTTTYVEKYVGQVLHDEVGEYVDKAWYLDIIGE